MKLHSRVEDCRKWLQEFEDGRFPDMVLAENDTEVNAIIVS
jgi:hypothetical protein